MVRKISISETDILNALNKFDGNRKKAAKSLGVSKVTLYRRLQDMEGKVDKVKHRPILQRLMDQISVVGECWNWTGNTIGRDGRGAIKLCSERFYVHRVSYMLFVGPVPEGLEVCHVCDNPVCCNPKHLFLGTHKENMHDMISKSRGLAKVHKITKDDAERIRKSRMSARYLSRKFNLSIRQVYRIKSGETWIVK